MSEAPRPYVVANSGDAGDAPAGAVPVSLYGAAAATHNQAATTVTVVAAPGINGANAQLVLADLAARIVALETP